MWDLFNNQIKKPEEPSELLGTQYLDNFWLNTPLELEEEIRR